MHFDRYHKQFFHGISSVSGKEFTDPVETRFVDKDLQEGLCHQCHQWIPVSNAKRKNTVLWYRHAHKVSNDTTSDSTIISSLSDIMYSVMYTTSRKAPPRNVKPLANVHKSPEIMTIHYISSSTKVIISSFHSITIMKIIR